MRAAIRLGLVALALWVGVELYQHGPGGAFGGALSAWGDEPSEPASQPPRAADAYDKSGARVDSLLADGEPK